ncbi:AMP-dependent synthetase and ligase [Chthoniobacter flavus Ellin428]|uniref:AMP-dependent synthetase and ligase n=1 Tax=Chthoniobacter flavus Ellin428 TaxID=497964 RepID=B4CY54_9BACT|nr:class I adenylate-forming enzyme family protein [Chthoniobacter flavus]EDY21202.1 AMP-dependent synthetase and ligase [Chthoniobacter flavus Ellin428]TCO87571.1 acyl-CoA synthetase (AMP-forming)/AMP-acid ligase II [Chthoniobacter flavus]
MLVPTSPDNPILTAWQQTLARCGQRPAVFSPTGAVVRTFVEIGLEALKIARLFDTIPSHSVVAVQIGNSEMWPEVVLALWRKKLIPLPLGEMTQTELAYALGTCRAAALVTNQGGPLIVHRRPVPDDARRWVGPTPEFLKLTSGTTSAPRAVRFRCCQLLADCENICKTMGFSDADLNYAVIPLSHSYGFSNLITPLIARGVPMVVSRDRMPRAVLEGLLVTNATVFPATPFFYQKLGELEQTPDLPALRVCISAGAPLTKRAGSMFSVKFGRKIHTFYGSSECGGIAYDTTEEPNYEDGFVGAPMQGVEIDFHAEQGAGPIQVRSEAVGDGYFPEDDRAVLSVGRFVPADLVERRARGLFIVGRTSEVINVAGRKLNPHEVEARLAEFPGVKQAVVFGVKSPLRGEEPVACIAGDDLAREAILRFCQEKLSPWQVPRDVWLVGEIPTNERGKISRRTLAESYRARHSNLS